MNAAQGTRILKEDALGRVERLEVARPGLRSPAVEERTIVCVRRVACGGRIPGSRWLARRLMARERRALLAIDGLPGVPRVLDDEELARHASPEREAPRRGDVLLRSWIAGTPLHRAQALPEDFFDHLDDLVLAMHARGVCHNDLHKEQNIVVGDDGYPCLVDFQLASRHPRASRLFVSRERDDLRHVEKHRRRYTRDGRGARGREPSRGRGHGLKRSRLAHWWRRVVKPVYLLVTRKLFDARDGEERRDSGGPWPIWTQALGPRRAAERPRSAAQ